MTLRLLAPSSEFEASYRSLIAEVRTAGERFVPFPLSYPFDDFNALLQRLADDSRGIGLDEGFVPSSTFWLVSGAGEIVGVSNLRHRLNPRLLQHGGHIGYGIRPSVRRRGFGHEILRLTLSRAKALGLDRALVTCGKKNAGSARIIVSNGGVLESEPFISEREEVVQRYWIDLKT